MNEKNLEGREKGLMSIPANYSLHRNREKVAFESDAVYLTCMVRLADCAGVPSMQIGKK